MESLRHLEQNDKICEQIDMNVFERCYPSEIVNEILAAQPLRMNKAGRLQRPRVRDCTPQSMVLFQLGCSLWRRMSQEQVWFAIVDALGDVHPDQPVRFMSASALSAQREKLGAEPFRQLIERCCQPLCTPQMANAFFHGLRVMAIDGTLTNVADTPANTRAFGRSRNQRGQGAYPQVRSVMLMECGSHAVIDAALGGYNWAEAHGVVALLRSVEPGMVVLGDCGIFSGYVVQRCREKGAHMVCGLPSRVMLAVKERLSDESYLSVLKESRTSVYRSTEKQTLRVIEYQVTDERLGKPDRVYRLVTTLLDEKAYPKEEIIKLYLQRWHVELMIRELKSTLHEQVKVLRSRTPEGVKQEVYGLLLAHYGVRWWMCEAGRLAKLEPCQLSCVNALQHIRRRVERLTICSINARQRILTRMVKSISQEVLPKPYMRRNWREIKRTYSKYKPKKRQRAAPKPFQKTETYLTFVKPFVRPLPVKKETRKPAKTTSKKDSEVA